MDGDTLSFIMWLVALAIFSYITQEMQILKAISEVEGYVALFRGIRDKAVKVLVDQFSKYTASSEGASRDVLEQRILSLIETRIILPVDLDPYGIVRKIKHVLRTSEVELEKEVSRIAKGASRTEVQRLSSLVEVARELNLVYKLVNHYYLIARKFKSLWLVLQLNAQMPFVLEEVKAIEGALESFSKGIPVGDSAGPLVAALLARKYKGSFVEPVKDTEISQVTVDGKKVFIVKAKGPGSTTGHLEEALSWIFSREKVSLIVSVDAALKLEGEESGSVASGYGVAMGGIGVERFEIEELSTKHGVPLFAVLIKMSEAEALSVMTEKVYQGVQQAVRIVEDIISRAPEGSSIVVLGVGNSLGVP
ncbi:DUF1512 domain-containing protein [Thermofilum pendens]|uniref:DUF1512 domain-containing protein n=1 Tax=Thermofilum pendens (strain DSM 2475 / Hrk 5) TaxID=368408 RepID=A1RY24_THEPD|nr:DUF1512 domain-containing protein [Thermofilum pendens]ABL78104.1 conserved hypothetical protein [Thermofilum pendens Hrk 5]